MSADDPLTVTAFDGPTRIAGGPLAEVALAAARTLRRRPAATVLVYDDADGRPVDLDLRGDDREVVGRLAETATQAEPEATAPRSRGRPRLGVVSREVTLLPRHWDWLRAQPGGASVALRRLVEEARRGGAGRDRTRSSREAAYRFLSAMAGDLPGYEEALRALFAGDRTKFEAHASAWPKDVRDYGLRLADGSWQGGDRT